MTIETFPSFYVKLTCTANVKRDRTSVTVLDKNGYELKFEFDSKKILENVYEFIEFIGVNIDKFKDSVKMKAY